MAACPMQLQVNFMMSMILRLRLLISRVVLSATVSDQKATEIN